MKKPSAQPVQPPRQVKPTVKRPVRSVADARDRLMALAPWAGLVLLALLAYLPVLSAGFIWDDVALTENPYVIKANGIWTIWFSPQLLPEMHYWPLV